MQIPGYRIIRRINHGGMSTVYLAVQLSVGREVALKIMSPALNADPVFGRRFQREANIVGQLSHPNIVSIYDIGWHNNLNYIAMDYLPSGTVHERMQSGMSTAEVLQVLRQIALALDHVHNKGYVHCDIKPENILFREDGTAVLTDFGVAKSVAAAVQGSSAGTIIGTPHYMSPEQSRGLALDGRSDLYSLGVVFYEMLVGAVPFRGADAVAIAIKHLSAEIPALPSQYAVYQQLIKRLLAKEADSRYQTGAELVTAIDIIEETLAGFPKRRTVTTDPAELNTSALFKALLRTSMAALQIKLRRSLGRLRPRSLRSEPQLESALQQMDTLEARRPTLLATRVSQVLQQSAPIGRGNSRRRSVVIGMLVGLMVISVWQSKLISFDAVFSNSFAELEADPTGAEATNLPASASAAENTALDDGPPLVETPPLASLTVHPQPSDARVRILNIRERYRPGIQLSSGRYHLEVSHRGYKTLRTWIDMQSQDLSLQYHLELLHKPGDVFTDQLLIGENGPEMVVIPAGNFVMGKEGVANAMPARTVSIPRHFAVSKYEISFELYDHYASLASKPLPNDRRWGRGRQPVINISWHDAMSFAHWLSQQTGQHYRLPTEAEWEYIARAGSADDFWWGQNEPGTRANCRRGCASDYAGFLSSRTAPVGSFPPNAFGVHDTAGNVAEWILDCYENNYEGAANDGSALVSEGCQLRGVRGGAASDDYSALYSFSRKGLKPDQSSSMVGFRLVRELVY